MKTVIEHLKETLGAHAKFQRFDEWYANRDANKLPSDRILKTMADRAVFLKELESAIELLENANV